MGDVSVGETVKVNSLKPNSEANKFYASGVKNFVPPWISNGLLLFLRGNFKFKRTPKK